MVTLRQIRPGKPSFVSMYPWVVRSSRSPFFAPVFLWVNITGKVVHYLLWFDVCLCVCDIKKQDMRSQREGGTRKMSRERQPSGPWKATRLLLSIQRERDYVWKGPCKNSNFKRVFSFVLPPFLKGLIRVFFGFRSMLLEWDLKTLLQRQR